jgi:hypothetical protein
LVYTASDIISVGFFDIFCRGVYKKELNMQHKCMLRQHRVELVNGSVKTYHQPWNYFAVFRMF